MRQIIGFRCQSFRVQRFRVQRLQPMHTAPNINQNLEYLSSIHKPPASIRFAPIKHVLAVTVEPFKFSSRQGGVAYELGYPRSIVCHLSSRYAPGPVRYALCFRIRHLSFVTRHSFHLPTSHFPPGRRPLWTLRAGGRIPHSEFPFPTSAFK